MYGRMRWGVRVGDWRAVIRHSRLSDNTVEDILPVYITYILYAVIRPAHGKHLLFQCSVTDSNRSL
jgi:hypothetical protein